MLFNAGTVSDRGMIACSCAKCVKSGAQHSSSEWEVHAGSRERRPAESIYLTELNFSLRVRREKWEFMCRVQLIDRGSTGGWRHAAVSSHTSEAVG